MASATAATKKESPTLCPLTADWQSRISDAPRSKGKTLKYRWIVIATKFGWSLASENDSELVMAAKHAICFADLVCTFKSCAELDPVECLNRINNELAKLTGKVPCPLDDKGKSDSELWVEFGKQIDEYYGVSYATVDVRAKLFGTTDDSEEGGEDE